MSMFDPPKTKSEARKYRYGRWSGNPRGNKFNPDYCAYEVFPDLGPHHQCFRKATIGPGSLYCGTHWRLVDWGES